MKTNQRQRSERLADVLMLAALMTLLTFANPCAAFAIQGTQTAGEPTAQLLSAEELEKLVARISLYPDSLLAHVIPASTVPIDIVEATRYLREQGGTVSKAPDDKPWDASVKALLNFPTVLEMMDKDLTWTRQLGDAVILQQADLMDAIQQVRNQAYASGTLESNDKQTIIVEQNIVQIQPADPTIIYVPTYTTQVTYVETQPDWVAGAVTFGVGVAVGVLLADDHCDWNSHGFHHSGHWGYHGGYHGDINVNRNVNRNTNRNVNRNTNGGGWSPSTRARTQCQTRRGATKARSGPTNPGSSRGRASGRSNSGRTTANQSGRSNTGRTTANQSGRSSSSRGSAGSSRKSSPFAGKQRGSNSRSSAARGNSSRSRAGQRSSGRSRSSGSRGGGRRGR